MSDVDMSKLNDTE